MQHIHKKRGTQEPHKIRAIVLDPWHFFALSFSLPNFILFLSMNMGGPTEWWNICIHSCAWHEKIFITWARRKNMEANKWEKESSTRMDEWMEWIDGWMDGWSFVFPLLVPFQSSVPKQRTHLIHIPNLIACHDSASANTHFLHCFTQLYRI